MAEQRIVQIPRSKFNRFVDRSSYLYNIRTKDNEFIGYTPNDPQKYLNKVREEEFARSKEIRGAEQCKIILLKGRQIGGTTDTAMFNLDTMMRINMAYGLILAHDDRTTPIIYEKYKLAYENMPDFVEITEDDGRPILNENGDRLIIPYKPETESYSGRQLQFADGTKSRVLVRTAGSGDNVGRGDTLNFCHLSEAASYDYFIDVLAAMNSSFPKHAFVYSIIESTANGVSGKGEGYYNLWKASEQGWNKFQNGVTQSFEGYRPVFICWDMMKEYRKPLLNGKLVDLTGIKFYTPELKKEFLMLEEQVIEERFEDRQEGLEAANWYRWMIKELCVYDYKKAMREYPTTPDQAFVSSDTSFFDTIKLFQIQATFEIEGEPEYETGRIDENYDFVEDRHGNLKIWEHPKRDYENRYIVSCDPSYGIEEGDYSCMFVFDRLEEKFVAKWYGNLKEDLLAEELIKLGNYYNSALVIPESNLKTVINLIEPDGLMPYEGPVYEHELGSGRIQYGFPTLSDTKRELIYKYDEWLRDNYDKFQDASSIKEHTTFIKKVTGGLPKYEASDGNHDDQVVAMALCIWAAFWWEEEIYTLDESKNDISKIFEAPSVSRYKNIKSANLGRKK
jgi:hypothetical protein